VPRESLVIALAGLAVLLTTFGQSFWCGRGHPSPRQEFAASKLVFTGTVVDSTLVPDSGSWMDGTMYRVRAVEAFRGKPDSVLTVFSENSSGRFPMTVGTEYLIFAYSNGGRLLIDDCGSSGPVTQARNALTAVRRLARSRE
jgi:hypothetical protein